MSLSILSRLDRGEIVDEPFPYLHREEALDPLLYAELAGAYPSLRQLLGDRPPGNNQLFNVAAYQVMDDPAMPAIWREFFAYHCSAAFLKEVLAFWGKAIDAEYPQLADWLGKPLSQVRGARPARTRPRPTARPT